MRYIVVILILSVLLSACLPEEDVVLGETPVDCVALGGDRSYGTVCHFELNGVPCMVLRLGYKQGGGISCGWE